VIDAGNSFLHARHLQVQADAAALAAAQGFQPCYSGSARSAEEANAAMYAKAGQYAGVSQIGTPSGAAAAATPLYNEQLGHTLPANVHALLNSKKYYSQSSPVDATAEEKPPCETGMIDVKLTETNLPWYFRVANDLLNGVPFINSHARVEILQATSTTRPEPLAVAESAPVAARAEFYNEDHNNEVIASAALSNTGPNAQGQNVWSNAGAPVSLAINKTNATTAHIGVRVALSGNPNDTRCGDPYVQCFDEKTGPLLHIAGYSNEGAGTLKAPLARQVTLSNATPDTCTDGYFSDSAGNCTFTISAKVDYGSTKRKGVTVTPIVNGTAGTALTYNSSSETWTGTATLGGGSASNEVSLKIKCAKESGSPCANEATEATIPDVHRIYAASSEHSGTIAGASISEVGGLTQDANSFEVCETKDSNACKHELVLTVDVAGSIADAAGFSDPLRQLRWEGEQGVRIGCPPPASPTGSQYRETLEQGCPGNYAINTSNPECKTKTGAYECITAGLPGKDVGPTTQGIDERIENDPGKKFYCSNEWQKNPNGGLPEIKSDDSRIIEVFVIPYGSLDAEGRSLLGNGEVPIQDFAAFYVTGFSGDKCGSDPSSGNAEVVGHFIKYIKPVNTNGGGPRCNPNSLGECVAVLTR
jgi:hypothetical protein